MIHDTERADRSENRSTAGKTHVKPRVETQVPLWLSDVLAEEFEELHGLLREPLPKPPNADLGNRDDHVEASRIQLIYEQIHLLPSVRAALCLSGGGIRSASFALGVIRGLAKRGVLRQFHYLSTVSGGGYIGGWLSAWIHRHASGLQGVCDELGAAHCGGRCGSQRACDGVEPAPISHLREYSNYLTPRPGLLTLDTWTLVATYLRNLVLNWLVLIPMLIGILLLPRLFASVLWMAQEQPYSGYAAARAFHLHLLDTCTFPHDIRNLRRRLLAAEF
jgi:hypothetical protein